ncbi:MAG: HAD-IG family 5'-nucleotidase [Sandaracinaceae bacterium]
MTKTPAQKPVSGATPGQLPLALPPENVDRGRPAEPAPASRVYVNRNLRMDAIAWIGFDMDYTLARYRQEAMDRLSIEATVRKMVERGRPESLLSARFDASFPIRGVHVDRKLGHVVKMDRYRYVKRAYHGYAELSRDERRRLYHSRPVHVGTKRFHWVDTLYALPEVAVYAGAIEHLESLARDAGSTAPLDYAALFDEVRECIDLAHRDGSINEVIAGDFPRYVERDPDLAETLARLRASKKQLFLLTNSGPSYTDRMMRFLLDGALPEHPSWRSYFDVVICSACKPTFFTRTDVPFVALDETLSAVGETTHLCDGVIHTGGCLPLLEKRLGVGGDQVLYVGDHIYGDVLRAKKESAWRTVMVLQEMTAELAALADTRAQLARLDELGELGEILHDEVRLHQGQLKAIEKQLEAAGESVPSTLAAARVMHKKALDRARARLAEVERDHDALEDAIDRAYHPAWGSIFKAGLEVSSFGDQVEQWACLYTDRVSNLGRYAPTHYFRGPLDRMPHER